MQPDPRLYASYVGGVARFVFAAILSALIVWMLGFMSLAAYMLWSSGWDMGVWMLGLVA